MSYFRKLIGGVTASLSVLLLTGGQAMALSQVVVYNNIASPIPGNVPSQAFEATSTSEFGGQVTLAGTERSDPKVTVLMSSWGCESGSWNLGTCLTTPGANFSHPITLNVYAVGAGNAPGALLGTKTVIFTIPFRPSADNLNCVGANATKWYNGTTCFNGFATPISFSLYGITLPNSVILSIAYNTTHYGYTPIGEAAPCYTEPGGCGYDSLNVGAQTSLSVGSQSLPDDAYINSSWVGAYCGGLTGAFRLDVHDDTQVPPCNWTGFQPSFKVEANVPAVTPPTNKDQCKKDGWKTFNNPAFKNQGQCVEFVEHLKEKGKDHHEGENDDRLENRPRF